MHGQNHIKIQILMLNCNFDLNESGSGLVINSDSCDRIFWLVLKLVCLTCIIIISCFEENLLCVHGIIAGSWVS